MQAAAAGTRQLPGKQFAGDALSKTIGVERARGIFALFVGDDLDQPGLAGLVEQVEHGFLALAGGSGKDIGVEGRAAEGCRAQKVAAGRAERFQTQGEGHFDAGWQFGQWAAER